MDISELMKRMSAMHYEFDSMGVGRVKKQQGDHSEGESIIIFDQPELWLADDLVIVNLAATIIGNRLSRFSGLNPQETFKRVFGEQHVRFNNAIPNLAYSTGNAVIFRRGKVALPLLVHEWGHTFDRCCGLRPQKSLFAEAVDLQYREGLQWPGMHPYKSDGGTRASERWANLFADWALQMLAQNEAGQELGKWVDGYMPGWIAIAMGVPIG
jgi:hypothetical protein